VPLTLLAQGNAKVTMEKAAVRFVREPPAKDGDGTFVVVLVVAQSRTEEVRGPPGLATLRVELEGAAMAGDGLVDLAVIPEDDAEKLVGVHAARTGRDRRSVEAHGFLWRLLFTRVPGVITQPEIDPVVGGEAPPGRAQHRDAPLALIGAGE